MNTQHPEPINDLFQQPEDANYRRFIFLVLRRWYWFVLCGLIGLAVAYFLNQSTQSSFSASSSIFIPSQTNGLDMRSLFSGYYYQGYSDIYNQMEILRSYSLNRQALENLNWRTSWYWKQQPTRNPITAIKRFSLQRATRYLKKVLSWKEIYPNDLFEVVEPENSRNLTGIPVYITPVSDLTYKISVETELGGGSSRQVIRFEETAAYGEPFANEWFHFSLRKNPLTPPDENKVYYFTFNDLNQQTAFYRGQLNVKLKDEYGDIIQLQITGTNPRRNVEYLNALVNAYIYEKLQRSTETQRRSIDFIDSQLAGISDSLSEAGEVFTEFRAQHQIIDLGAKGEQVMQNLEKLDSELTRNRMKLEYFRNLQVYMESADPVKQLVAPSVVGVEDVSLNALVMKLGELYGKREVLSFSARENNPTLIMLDQEILQTSERLKENLKNLIADINQVIKGLERQRATVSGQLSELPGKEQNLINIQRKYDITNEIYTFLLQKRAEIFITLAASVSDVQVIDQARMETIGVIGTSNSRRMLFGTAAGIAIPLLILLLMNYFDNTIKSRDDVERNTRLPILGNVIHSDHPTQLVAVNYPRSGLAESYRSIRTNLQYLLTERKKNIIAIQSTSPEEGKSFTAINLACILAMKNNNVLLVECDLRKPKVHQAFDISQRVGLSTYLIGNNPFDEIVFKTPVDHLWLVPSGPVPPNPAELLDKKELGAFFQTARDLFDYIVVDNAPVSVVTDGLITGRQADINLFVLRADVSHKQMIKLINELAEKQLLPHISLIINDIKTGRFINNYSYRSSYHYAGYYHRYGKGYYAEEEKKKSFWRIFQWNKRSARKRKTLSSFSS